MSKYHDAADALKRAAVKYEGLMSAAKALEEVGSLEQAAKEYKASAAAALKERDENLDEVVKVKEQLKKLKAEAADSIAKAKEKIDLMMGVADGDIDRMRIDAATKAEQARAAMLAPVQAQIDALTSDATDLSARKANLQIAIDELNKDRAEAESLAIEAEKRLAKVKEAIAKLSA